MKVISLEITIKSFFPAIFSPVRYLQKERCSIKRTTQFVCAEQQICSQTRLWDNNRPWVRVIVFIHGSASVSDAAGSVVITALTSWLAWAAVCPTVWASGKDHRSTISHSFSFHPPTTGREVGALCSSTLTSNAVCCLIPSLYSCFTVCWATLSLSKLLYLEPITKSCC